MLFLFFYLLPVNALAFFFMLADKHKAKRGAWRIPEATLMGIAVIGGSYGALAGMLLFRHKTRHLKFSLGLPILAAIHTVLAIPLCILL